ncbi:MAG: protein ImuB [Actinomycetota bacterium]|jgi:protein ImuB|nr:protein ImuB [Actinomycetota bacterium]
MSGVRTLVVWCPDWPVVAAGFDGTTVPVAVLFANRVVACSAAARAEGVKRGLRRREAQSRCPEVVVLERDPARDARAFEPAVAAVEALTPGVEILRPGMCALPTLGPSRYFGGDEALAHKVAQQVEPFAPDARAGIADGPFAATLAARRGLLVDPGQSPAFLAPFPVSALLGAVDRPELVDLLRRLGLRTLGALAALPATDVLARFGTEGALAHRLARGLDERPVAARVPPPDLAVAHEIDPPADRVDTAAFAAKALADRLDRELTERGLACTRIVIEAETEHGETLSRVWRHEGPLTPAAMAERMRWQLDGWLNGSAGVGQPTAGLTLLRLIPDEVVSGGGRQNGFWGGAAESDERAGRALARVQGMLGPDAVTTAVITGARSPAEQVGRVPWGEPRAEPRSGRTTTAERPAWPGRVPAPAPAIVPPVPLQAEVVDADGHPVAVTGRGLLPAEPRRVSVEGDRWADIEVWAGPWPIDERWWDPPAHRRRARFQLVTSTGAAYLAVLEGRRWWIEAIYD